MGAAVSRGFFCITKTFKADIFHEKKQSDDTSVCHLENCTDYPIEDRILSLYNSYARRCAHRFTARKIYIWIRSMNKAHESGKRSKISVNYSLCFLIRDNFRRKED